jgi:hypothetical protein
MKPEHELQCLIIKWLRLAYPGTLYTASIAGQYSTRGQRCAAWRAGYVSGSPDIFIFKAIGKYHGLHIEVKSKKGRQKESQKAWQEHAAAAGYKYIVPHDIDEAIRYVMAYMRDDE